MTNSRSPFAPPAAHCAATLRAPTGPRARAVVSRSMLTILERFLEVRAVFVPSKQFSLKALF